MAKRVLSVEEAMLLPDNCFGRIWPITLTARGTAGAPAWDISEIGLPENFVIWEITGWSPDIWTASDTFRLALGDQLPVTTAEMDALDPLVPGFGITGLGPRQIYFAGYAWVGIRKIRMNSRSAGRRIILEVNPGGGTAKGLQVVIAVSSIPKEVPDWLH